MTKPSKPRKNIITRTKHGTFKSRAPIKENVESYLRMANAGKSKRKPSMPKITWGEEDA